MEVVMFIQPTLAAYIIYYQRLDLEKEAYNAVARRQFRPEARPVKLKIQRGYLACGAGDIYGRSNRALVSSRIVPSI